jgi:hypothetical protein
MDEIRGRVGRAKIGAQCGPRLEECITGSSATGFFSLSQRSGAWRRNGSSGCVSLSERHAYCGRSVRSSSCDTSRVGCRMGKILTWLVREGQVLVPCLDTWLAGYLGTTTHRRMTRERDSLGETGSLHCCVLRFPDECLVLILHARGSPRWGRREAAPVNLLRPTTAGEDLITHVPSQNTHSPWTACCAVGRVEPRCSGY